jgi:cyclic beta-1,2-glucan synthetase
MSGWRRLVITLGSAAGAIFSQVVLAFDSFLVIDALARVMWRLGISRKHLLDWAPRRDFNTVPASLAAYWRALWISPAIGGLTLATLTLWSSGTLPLAAPFALAWIAAPAAVGLGDRHLFNTTGSI